MPQINEFLDDSGNPGADPVRVPPAAVAAAWGNWTQRIAPTFAVASADHETNFAINQRDTEDTGKQTGGIFQLTLGGTITDILGDASLLLHPEKDPFNLDDACFLFALKSLRDMDAIMRAAGLTPGTEDAQFWAAGGAAYLTVAHNQGRTAALTTVGKYGLDWNAYAARNRGVIIRRDDGAIKFNGPRVVAYGDDAISGGPYWDPAFVNPSDGGAVFTMSDPTSSLRLRAAVLALVALLVAYWAATRGPLKGAV